MAHSVEVLIPAQRYVFALEDGTRRAASRADVGGRLPRLQAAPEEGKVAAMIAIPNCCLVRAGEDYVVDPG